MSELIAVFFNIAV